MVAKNPDNHSKTQLIVCLKYHPFFGETISKIKTLVPGWGSLTFHVLLFALIDELDNLAYRQPLDLGSIL
jgi:hypothetical protein